MLKPTLAVSASTKDPDGVLENCIEAIAAGDAQALAQLYQKTHGAVYGFALSMVKNCHDAEDVVQDVYIKIWESAGSYQAMGKPLAWIFTITRNDANMCLRRQGKITLTDPQDWEAVLMEDPDMQMEDRVVLTSVMSLLGEEDRQIVILHAVAGMKHREIAELMDMKLSTVLSRYNRALEKLRQAL